MLPFLLSLAVFLFAFLLYRNTVPNDYTLDDAIYYTGNKFVQQDFKGMKGIFTKSTFFGFNGKNDILYRPLPLACFAVQHSFFGNNPHANHFVNVLLYSLCCSFLLFLLCRLLRGTSLAVLFCITLLFTAHPVHTEVVASIKGQDEILAFLFFILTLHFLLLHDDRKSKWFLAASVSSFFLCILCKEHGLTMLGILPLALYTFRSTKAKNIALRMVPFCIAALSYLLFRNSILDHFTFGEPLAVINNTLMAAHNTADQLATAFVILGKYLRLLFIPWPLCWDYSYNQIPITDWADPKAIISLAVYAGMLAGGVAGAIKKSPLAFTALFFLLSFSLSSNLFMKIGVTLGERLLFTPSLGFCIAAVIVVSKTTARLRFRIPLAAAAMAAVIAAYAVIIINRNTDWKDNFTLFSRDIVKNRSSASAHNSLGANILYKGRLEKDTSAKAELLSRAIAEFRQSVAIFPGYTGSWYLLGNACNEAGLADSAISAYRKAVELQPDNKSASNNLGVIFFKRKEYDSAVSCFRRVISFDTNNVTAYVNLGAAEILIKNYTAAVASFKKVIALDPRNKDAREKLNRLSVLLNDTALARQYRPSIDATTGK
jgi:protein O-mannosyl-transferase